MAVFLASDHQRRPAEVEHLVDGIAIADQLREATSEAIDIGDRVVLGTESREEAVDLLTFRPAST